MMSLATQTPAEHLRITSPEERLHILWALRIATHIPEALNARNHRCGVETILQLIGPRVPWPDDLMHEFSHQINAEFRSEVLAADEEATDAPDEEAALLRLREKLWQIDCAVLTKPFQSYQQRHPRRTMLAIAMALKTIESQQGLEKGLIETNVDWFAQLLNLNSAESAFLLISVCTRQSRQLVEVMQGIPFNGNYRAAQQFGAILDQPPHLIQRVLDLKGVLHRVGLFKHHRFSMTDLEDLLPNDLKMLGTLSMAHESPQALVEQFLEKSKGTSLCAEDFGHLSDEFQTLTTMIKNALLNREKNVHILFYGPPGTGKTEMARLLAKTVGCALFEVRWRDDDHEPAGIPERLMGLELGLNFLSTRQDAFLLFDEVEAVIEGDSDSLGELSRVLGAKSHGRNQNKAWINETLENESTVPTIWIANEIDRFDPAFLRRFVYCLEFTIPPKLIRHRAIDRYFEGMELSAEFRTQLAGQWITPAQIEIAKRATRLLKPKNQQDIEKTILRSIQSSMALLGQPFLDSRRHPTDYRLEYLNVETPIPIEEWVDIARQGHPLSICLAGPPGCGKTQLVSYLANEFNKPLLTKRSSDILDKWVGGTEANLAALFREAETERAILLLDEADTFLRNRELAGQAWQVSQVNELLQQMESFHGIFFCTTNRFDDLDPAALRRFSLKVRFHAMTADQRWRFFVDLTGMADEETSENLSIKQKLNQLEGLTPGDFSVAVRTFHIRRQTPSAPALLTALEQEMRAKQWNARQTSIGFVH